MRDDPDEGAILEDRVFNEERAGRQLLLDRIDGDGVTVRGELAQGLGCDAAFEDEVERLVCAGAFGIEEGLLGLSLVGLTLVDQLLNEVLEDLGETREIRSPIR